jgi:hypothetical protein
MTSFPRGSNWAARIVLHLAQDVQRRLRCSKGFLAFAGEMHKTPYDVEGYSPPVNRLVAGSNPARGAIYAA